MDADPPISARTIATFARGVDAALPATYIDLAMKHHGGAPSRMTIDFPKRPEAVFQRLLSFSDGPLNIREAHTVLCDAGAPASIVPFGADPFGNFFCFDYRGYRGSDPPIVFWDHETAAENPAQAISPVCKNFDTLLHSLYRMITE
jgi:hypothetical protein